MTPVGEEESVTSTVAAVPVAVLAAGEGSRLADGSAAVPKPCRSLLGRSLAEWTLRSFSGAGLDEFRIVIGHRGDEVREHYLQAAARVGVGVSFLEAEEWRRGNGVSALRAARSFGDRPFLLTMADHLFSPSLIAEVLENPPGSGGVRLAVDRSPAPTLDLDDLTKVRLDGDRIVAIGKHLERWDAGDTGLFYASNGLAEGLARAREKGLFSLSDGVGECAAVGLFSAIRLRSSGQWMDIDTPADLRAAEQADLAWLARAVAG